MFSQFSWQKQAYGCLDLSTGDGRPLVIVGKSRGLGSDSFEDVVDEAVHDAHGLAGNTSVWVNLFQDFVDVNSVRFLPPPLLLLLPRTLIFGLCGRFFRSLRSDFWWHVDRKQSDTAIR